MTTCLRSMKLKLHPKLSLLKGRQSTSFAGLPLPKTQSNFLCEFLDGPCDRNVKVLIDLKNFTPIGTAPAAAAWAQSNSTTCHTFDPSLHTVLIQRSAVTTDDILFHSNSNLNCCDHFMEDDLKRDIIQRNHYSVTVLLESLPCNNTGVLEKWPQKVSSLAELQQNAVFSRSIETKSSLSLRDSAGKPTDEQLELMYLKLCDTLPKFFTHIHNYALYHPQLVFQNNIRGVTTYGIGPYIRQLYLLKLVARFKFAYVKMDILKATKHSEDATIRVRWQIRGISGLKVFLQFWKFRLWDYKTVRDKEIVWYDGFSTFHVGSDGLIHQHVCDKMMPDNHKEKSTAANLVAKLALIIGVIPRPSLDTLGGLSLAFLKNYDEDAFFPTNT